MESIQVNKVVVVSDNAPTVIRTFAKDHTVIFKLTKLLLWLSSKFALVNSKEFRREVKDDRCYSQESLYSQDNNLVHLTKADDRRITRMKT